jgi:hypothetical protein
MPSSDYKTKDNWIRRKNPEEGPEKIIIEKDQG